MATSVPQATADRRTTMDAVRWEGERLRSVRRMPARAGGLARQHFGPPVQVESRGKLTVLSSSSQVRRRWPDGEKHGNGGPGRRGNLT